jgi:hypothetical protein
MDPNATYRDLISALVDGDRELARELGESLANWIRSGGFLPTNTTPYNVGVALNRAHTGNVYGKSILFK